MTVRCSILHRSLHVLSLSVAACVACSHHTPYVAPGLVSNAGGITPEDVRTRVLLIGDAGAAGSDDPVLAELAAWAGEISERTTIAFLGDIVYPYGLVDELDPDLHKLTRRRLDAQLDVVRRSGARGIFIPGNHDWAHGGPDGLLALDRLERAVEHAVGPGAFIPSGGCAGPEAVDLDGVRLIVLDSEWFLQDVPASPCPHSEASIATELGRLVADSGTRHVIVLAHHPIRSHGPHGGFFDWRDHVFPLSRKVPWLYVPLPGLGSLYPLWRGVIRPARQDIDGGRYGVYVETVTDAVRPHVPLLFAAGHEHGLQVLDGGDAFGHLVISGAGSGSRLTALGHGDDTLFAHANVGFMCVDVLRDDRVSLRVVEPGPGVVFSRWLTGDAS